MVTICKRKKNYFGKNMIAKRMQVDCTMLLSYKKWRENTVDLVISP